MIDIVLSPEEADSFQWFVYNHLMACQSHLDMTEEEVIEEGTEEYGVYCGCDTCDGREMIMAVCDWLKTNRGVDIYVR